MMKKILFGAFTIFVISVFFFAGAIRAESEDNENETGNRRVVSVSSPSAVGVANQNQVTTRNEGEDSELEVETKEMEGEDEATEGSKVRNPVALEHMSAVAEKVQELLKLRTSGGIGDQVREIAREQNESQTHAQEQLDLIDSRGSFARFILGPNYRALNDLGQVLEQNQLRIQALQELQNQLSYQADKDAIDEAIQALLQQNESLQQVISTEEQARSVFGWLIKLFVK